MTGDFTAVPLRDGDAWTGARLQQGRVLLDGDWNLNVEAAARDRRLLALATIGPAGVRQGSSGFKISFSDGGALEIGAGTMWVGGLSVVNPVSLAYAAQQAIAPLPAAGTALVYLDAFVQEVQAAEAPQALLDPALDNVDTVTRTRVAWRVRAVSVTATGCAGASAALPADLISSGLLDVTHTAPAAPADPCAPPEDPRVRLPDGLLRVEVLDSGTESSARFAWSYENGAAAVAATAVAGDTVTLAPSPATAFARDDLVEVSTLERRADRLPHGPLFSVVDVDQSAARVTLSPPSTVTGAPDGVCLRRWDGQAVGAAAGVPATVGGLDVGVAFTARPGTYLTGDWWVTRVRGSAADAVDTLTAAPPDGTPHWVAALAVVDLDGHAVLGDCRPQFPPLTGIGGCCTLNVQPSDLHGEVSLQSLLDGYANVGTLTVCLAPGTYPLIAPLVLGSQLSGVTLQGCGPGVVLRGPDQPGPEFAMGLVVVDGATAVTVRDLEMDLPAAPFTPAADAFDGLPANNKALMTAFANGLVVAIGITTSDASDLRVTDCVFRFSDPGQANLFGAAIRGTGVTTGVELTRCHFLRSPAPPTAPFYDLTVGAQAPPPYQVAIGYLQVTASQQNNTVVSPTLRDMTLERCLFEGVTVPVIAMGQLGMVRIGTSVVRNCYGGFWVYEVLDLADLALFDEFADGNPDAVSGLASEGALAFCDRVVPIASAMARVLPPPPSGGGVPHLRRIAPPSAALRDRIRLSAGFLGTWLRDMAGDELAADLPLGVEAPAQVIPPAETGTGTVPRLELRDCEIDAVLLDSYSGAALIAVNLNEKGLMSAVVNGNRMRSRYPRGETAMGIQLTEACVTGNIIANEVALSAQTERFTSFSLAVVFSLTPLGAVAVAVFGNVLIDPPLLGREEGATGINTVVNYNEIPTVTALQPTSAFVGNAVVITGTGFTAATAVSFGGTSATFTITSDTQISTTAPSTTAVGTVDVTVTTPAGTSPPSAADQFTYQLG